ncbi:YbdD/YjiX family protein [Pseudomonas sp. GCM10022188]|uniref:YbdD/YjiX family protein n=1 Tax=Pseudomonas TaxID=286 RepID=UPI001E61416B|nr:YbdD/YjiX family protein [Pseudomonas oryzagri]MCC6074288.1 YbdD/YjiX family protein [Pseudomonas oryzagri]
MFNDLSRMGKYLGQAARMLVGMPDYDTYLEHMQSNHPEQTPMSYEAFFRERQDARYGGGKGRPVRCC